MLSSPWGSLDLFSAAVDLWVAPGEDHDAMIFVEVADE